MKQWKKNKETKEETNKRNKETKERIGQSLIKECKIDKIR